MPTLVPAIDAGEIDLAGNTYVTLEQANNYLTDRANTTKWFEQGDEERERALLTVIDLLDPSNWIGAPVQENQPLSWPRVAIRPMERRSRRLVRTGFETLTGARGGLYDAKSRFWATTSIPTPIQHAQCELAFALLINSFDVDGEDSVKSFSADNVSVTFNAPRSRTELPMMVRRLLAPLVMVGVETMRG